MTDHDDLVRRLHALAEAPVDPTAAAQHLHALQAADAFRPAAVVPRRRRWASVGAVAAGLFMGSAALAGAATGNLPDAAQDTAHEALAKVGINVPKAKGKVAKTADDGGTEQSPADANREGGPGKVERFTGDDTEPCTNADGTAFEGTHGQYVKGHEDDDATADVNERQEAAQSRCGKPIQAGGDDGADDGTGPPDDTGRPESPGQSEDHRPAGAGKPDGAGKPEDVPRGPKD